MKCRCRCDPRVKSGQPAKEGDKVYWQQIFFCDNPGCQNYQKDIGKRMINIFDEQDVKEEIY